MSTLPIRYSPMDLDPHVGLHRPSPLACGEQLSEAEQYSPTPHEESDEESEWKEDLCHAISGNNWSEAKKILDQKPNALTAKIAYKGRTALHAAAMLGCVTIVEELLKLLPSEFLLTTDSDNDTALALTSWYSGNIEIAEHLVKKNRAILDIPNKYDVSPITLAFENGYHKLGSYLYYEAPLDYLTGIRGCKLLFTCIQARCFDVALDLLQRCEELLLMADGQGEAPIHYIATLNIPSPSELIFWKRWIYNGHGLLQRLIASTDNFVGVKEIQELKLLHAQADKLLRLVCKNARKAYQSGVLEKALYGAAREGNAKFILQVSKEIPEIFLNPKILLLFNEALVHRQASVFNLIRGHRFKSAAVASIAAHGNNLMHQVAMKAPNHVLNRIYAPTLQMQSELQWFEEVESLLPPNLRASRNTDGMTGQELFRENHKELMKEGEKWIKATSSSCSLVGTLIMTIMFAAAYTVPGGNDQSFGYPLFIKQPFFMVFIFSTILSLLSSSTSVLMFLAILTSKYSEKKFLKSLPTKLILGLSFLFLSIVSMILAFLSTIYLMVNHTSYLWGVIPIIIVASVPVIFFVYSQFPLLLHTWDYTYGNTFGTKVQPWP